MNRLRLPFSATLTALLIASQAAALEAVYEVAFENLWNPTAHPNSFPGSAHFSPLVGASHGSDVSFWATGELATPGVELVAELGNGSTFLNSEVNGALGSGTALQSFNNSQNIFLGQSTSGDMLAVSDEYPLVTLLSMIAPSSDWFVGVHDLDLREGGSFAESRVIEFASFYDAGTEEGAGFSLGNPATVPQQPITLVSGAAAAEPFLGAGAATLPPIARLTLTRVSLIPEPGAAALLVLATLITNGKRIRR